MARTWKQWSAMLVKSRTEGCVSCSILAAIIWHATAVSCRWLQGTACKACWKLER